MIKTDLKEAGIPYKVDGKFADFHCLWHSTASLLIQTGANPKVIQSLMRHSDLNLTMSKYTHIYAGQQRETIENLKGRNRVGWKHTTGLAESDC